MRLFVLRLFVFTLACCSAAIVLNKVNAQAVPPGSEDKPTEQVQKNIKVLTGMPQSQLIPVMNYFAASMGRRCNFCHVNNQGQWDYAVDTKPEKNQAREMIKMVLDTNKNYFKGNLEVSCYTCHRGVNHPASVPPLPLPQPSAPANQPNTGGAAGAQPQASPTPRPSPPAPEALIEKYVQAIGGQASIDKIKSRTMKGTFTSANGNSGTFEILQVGSDKAYESVVTQRGSVERGVSSNSGWEKSQQGVREITGQPLAELQLSLQLFRNLRLKEEFTRLRFGGRDKVGDRDAYVVIGNRSQTEIERLFFDVETGLLLRRIGYLRTMIGIIPNQIDFEDYRDVDGVKVPFTIRRSTVDAGSAFSVRKLTEIKLNAPVDESKFAQPATAKP